jgi:hypothetical protein
VARRITVVLVDDLAGGPADVTVRFRFEGVEYEIDLSHENATTFRDQLAPYIERARTVRRGARRPRRTGGGDEPSSEIREWARQTGIEVSERGRIPGSIKDRYYLAADRPPGPYSIPVRKPK